MNWHRIFGLLLSDFFSGSPFVVELEKDLSLKKQLLDVVIVRKGKGEFTGSLPDGLENLGAHNLITFKSHQEALDDWARKELTGHYVNYRKQVSQSLNALLPESEFRLYAVTSRFPRSLARSVSWQAVRDGVYKCKRGSDEIRVVVAHELPHAPNNALLHLLSASPSDLDYGVAHYRQRSADTSTLLGQVVEGYQKEGVSMSYTMEDFRRDYVKEHMKDLTLQERLEDVSPQELLKSWPPEKLLRLLPGIEKLARRHKKEPTRKRKKNQKP
jgi:hypothetical protein